MSKFTWQSDLVAESIGGFVINLAEAVLIVLVVLTLAMGWCMGLVIGWSLIVTILGTFMGSGGPRFYLPVDPEFPYSSFAKLIVNTPTFAEVNPLVAEYEPWLNENYPQVLTRVRKIRPMIPDRLEGPPR